MCICYTVNISKVLHITESFGAGVSCAIESYVTSTSSNKHYLLYSNSRGQESEPKPNYFLNTYRLPRNPLLAYWKIRRVVNVLRPDVVHIHSSFAGVYARIRKLKFGKTCSKCAGNGKKYQPKIVYSPHCYAFERRDIGRFKRTLYYAIEKLLSPKVDVYACCSYRELELSHRINKKKRALFIPNLSELEAIMHNSTKNAVVVTIGRVSPQKNPKLFNEIATNLPKYKFLWVGDGKEEHKAELISSNIKVTGWLDLDRISHILQDSTVYLHTASWEGFPIAILDAQSAGLPIIASDADYLQNMPDEWIFVDVKQGVEKIKALKNMLKTNKNRRQWTEALVDNTREFQRTNLNDCYY
ncbi:glycosyl transferase [Actinomycetota bacterium]|nr:glycosyl transferase [Actinomycetota bacterium]